MSAPDFERLTRSVSLGDAEAVPELITESRRRDRLDVPLEVFREVKPTGAVREAFFEGLLFATREAGGASALIAQKAQAWSADLQGDRSDLLALLLSLASGRDDWNVIREAAETERITIESVVDVQALFDESASRPADADALFALTDWYQTHVHEEWVTYSEGGEYRPMVLDVIAREHWLHMLGCHADHEAAPWIVLQLFDAWKDTTIKRAQAREQYERLYLEVFGDRSWAPFLHLVLLRNPLYSEVFWAWLSEHPIPRAAPCYLERLQSAKKAERDAAMPALSALGTQVLPAIWTLLEDADAKKRTSAAQVLELIPSPRSLPAIDATLATKQPKAVKDKLQIARTACQLALDPSDAAALDDAALDAELAARKLGKRPALLNTLEDSILKPLVWRSTAEPMSEGAREAFLRQLMDAGPHGGAATQLIRERLADEGCHALAETFWTAFCDRKLKAAEMRGLFFSQRALASDALIAQIGSKLEWVWRSKSHTWSTHGVTLLSQRATPEALHWLEHWAFYSKKTLQKAAINALDEHAKRAQTTWDGLLERALPTLDGTDRKGDLAGFLTYLTRDVLEQNRAAFIQRLTRALVTRRAWSPEAWRQVFTQPLAREVVHGLLFEVTTADTAHHAHIAEGDAWLDIEGQPVTLEDTSTTIRLAHPALMASEQRDAWLKKAKALNLTQASWQLERPVHDPKPAAVLQSMTNMTWRNVVQAWALRNCFEPRHGVGYERSYPDGTTVVFHFNYDPMDYIIFSAVTFERDGAPISTQLASPLAYSEAMIDSPALVELIVSNEAYYEMWQE